MLGGRRVHTRAGREDEGSLPTWLYMFSLFMWFLCTRILTKRPYASSCTLFSSLACHELLSLLSSERYPKRLNLLLWYEGFSPSGELPMKSSSFVAILNWCDRICGQKSCQGVMCMLRVFESWAYLELCELYIGSKLESQFLRIVAEAGTLPPNLRNEGVSEMREEL